MKYFIGEVRNNKDDWESGRVQVRIYGKHDDEQNIKDEDLPWSMVLLPITSASTNRIGTSPTGLLKGSRVMGYFLDSAEQYPVIIGSFPRAGKQKTKDDNTKGKNDIDAEYSDVPLAAIGSANRTDKTHFKNDKSKTKVVANVAYQSDPKYNQNEYAPKEGEDGKEKSREKFAKSADKNTVGSLDKTDNKPILEKILKVDGSNDSGALPQAPQMFQQIMQVSNMTSMGGITSMTSGSMGSSLSGIAGNIGIGNVLGSMSGMLGIDLSMLSGMTGMLGSRGGSGGSSGSGIGGAPGGAFGTYYAEQVPTTPNDIAVTAAELLNQLGGYSTPTNEIAGLTLEEKEILYRAMIELMNSVDDNLNVNTTITVSSSSQDKLTLQSAPPEANIEIIISQTESETISRITLPGSYLASVNDIPDGYIPVYYFTETDPYPGYMEWASPEGEAVFCPRPEDRPYTATPTEDSINAGIIAILNNLLNLIITGKLTLAKKTELIAAAKEAVTNNGNENTLGKNTNKNNNMMQSLLGILGQLLGQLQSNQLPGSVLDNSKINQSLEKYQKKNADLRKKKQLAKQAVQSKNESQNLMNSNLLNFGNKSGKGNGGSSGVPGGTTASGTVAPQSNVVTYITKSGNTVTQIATLPANNVANGVTFGYYSIYKG